MFSQIYHWTLGSDGLSRFLHCRHVACRVHQLPMKTDRAVEEASYIYSMCCWRKIILLYNSSRERICKFLVVAAIQLLRIGLFLFNDDSNEPAAYFATKISQ